MASVDTLLNQLRYTNRARVKADMDKLAKEYKTLIPRAVDYVHDNGSQSRLIVLSGTVPIFYNSVQYNIPVDLFLMVSYPSEPPKLFVRPTPNMTVKANHRHVSPDGLCYLPYLAEWSTNSNLNGLVEIASSVFSIEPPLFTKPPGSTATSPTNTVVSPVSQPSQRSTYSNSTYTQPAVAHPSYTTTTTSTTYNNPNGTYNNGTYESYDYASPASHSSSVYSPASTTPGVFAATTSSFQTTQKEAEADKKAQLIDQVSMRMYEEIDRKQRILRDELDCEMALSSTLNESADQAAAVLRNLKASTVQYTEALHTLNKQSEEFDLWNSDQTNHPIHTAEERAVPFDPLSQQIVRLHSEVNAIDDAFYHLERALVSSKNQSVDLTTFLKECRQLARKQFLCKAHLKKISAECMQVETVAQAAQTQQAHTIPHTEYTPQTVGQAYTPHTTTQTHHYPQNYTQPPPAPTHTINTPLVRTPTSTTNNTTSIANNTTNTSAGSAYARYDGVSAVPYPGAGAVVGRY